MVIAKTATSNSDSHNVQRMTISPLTHRVIASSTATPGRPSPRAAHSLAPSLLWAWEDPVTPSVGVRQHHGAILISRCRLAALRRSAIFWTQKVPPCFGVRLGCTPSG